MGSEPWTGNSHRLLMGHNNGDSFGLEALLCLRTPPAGGWQLGGEGTVVWLQVGPRQKAVLLSTRRAQSSREGKHRFGTLQRMSWPEGSGLVSFPEWEGGVIH